MSNNLNTLYLSTALQQSKAVTKAYSSSFSRSVKLLHPSIQPAIYAIYGMVRIADEIVDTRWDGIDPVQELNSFEASVYRAIDQGYSSDLILHSFAWCVNEYSIPKELIASFFVSMRMDTEQTRHDQQSYKIYIYGSAEVIGLMSLYVFEDGNKQSVDVLSPGAMALGAAFQKVNFLRDIYADYNERGRIYFPDVFTLPLTVQQKKAIESDIKNDFDRAEEYIAKLPFKAQKGVRLAFMYYKHLYNKIIKAGPQELSQRLSGSILLKLLLSLRGLMNV